MIRTLPPGGSMAWLVQWVGRTPFGPRSGILFGNNMRDVRHHDQDGRITELETLIDGTSSYSIHWTYQYGDKRNLTGITDLLNAADSQVYGYTANGFLQTALGPWGTPGAVSTETWSRVSGSNRLSGVSTDGTPSRSFTSDDAGNIIGDTDLATSTTKELAYNHPGQLATVEIGGTPKGSYLYDYLSRLVSRTLPASSTTLHLVHDLDGNVLAEYDSSGTLLREYVWLDDRPVAAITAGMTPVTYWVHTDHLERPVMMTDNTNAVVWQASYLPYGEIYSITGSASIDYRFPGQWFQLESGLHYNWHRHYDPTTGRYVQPDPLGMPDGPSRWAYVGNSPLMNVDPSGQVTIPLGPAMGAWDWLKRWLFPPYCEYDPNNPITDDGGLRLGRPPVPPTGQPLAPPDVLQSQRPRGFWPLPSGAAEWGRRNKVPPDEARRRAHRKKEADNKSAPDDDYSVNPETGEIADPEGEIIDKLDE